MFIKKKEYNRLIKQLEKVENLYFKQIDAIVQKGIEIAELKKKNEDLKNRLNSVWDAHEKIISPEYEQEIETRLAIKIFDEILSVSTVTHSKITDQDIVCIDLETLKSIKTMFIE